MSKGRVVLLDISVSDMEFWGCFIFEMTSEHLLYCYVVMMKVVYGNGWFVCCELVPKFEKMCDTGKGIDCEDWQGKKKRRNTVQTMKYACFGLFL